MRETNVANKIRRHTSLENIYRHVWTIPLTTQDVTRTDSANDWKRLIERVRGRTPCYSIPGYAFTNRRCGKELTISEKNPFLMLDGSTFNRNLASDHTVSAMLSRSWTRTWPLQHLPTSVANRHIYSDRSQIILSYQDSIDVWQQYGPGGQCCRHKYLRIEVAIARGTPPFNVAFH